VKIVEIKSNIIIAIIIKFTFWKIKSFVKDILEKKYIYIIVKVKAIKYLDNTINLSSISFKWSFLFVIHFKDKKRATISQIIIEYMIWINIINFFNVYSYNFNKIFSTRSKSFS